MMQVYTSGTCSCSCWWCSPWPNYEEKQGQGTKTHTLRMADAYPTQRVSVACGGVDRQGVESSGDSAGAGWRALAFAYPFWTKKKSFLELPFRGGFDTVSGRAAERGGKSWRTADSVHLYSHYRVGLGEAADTQMPVHVKFCRRNVEKSLIRRTQWTDRWVHGGCTVGACRTPSTSDADTPPTTCARLSRHAILGAMLLL